MTDPIPSSSEIENLLPLWVGGDLEPEQMELVEAALAHDPALRAQAQRARSAREVFRAELRAHADDDALPEGVASVWPGLRAQLLEEGLISSTARSDRAHEHETLVPIRSLNAARASSPRPSAPKRIASRLAMGAGLAAAAVLLVLMRPWQGSDQQGTDQQGANARDAGGELAFQPAAQGPIDALPASDGVGALQLVLDQEGLLRPAGLLDERIAEQVWNTLGRQGFGVPEQDPLSDGQQHQAVSGSNGPFLLTPTTLPGLR